MQDRYAGDVGDFIKLGLLRRLAAAGETGPAGLVVGLNWYLAPDEAHNADGKHIAYLQPQHRQHHSLAACDPALLCSLSRVVARDRSVAALNGSGALPSASPMYSERLDPSSGHTGRSRWHQRALERLAGADIVFVDPDNGISVDAGRARLHKYALISELADYAHRGQSLVAYHHADRTAAAVVQARRRLEQLAAGVQQQPIGAVIARRGSCRFFLITAAPEHGTAISTAIHGFMADWSAHADFIDAH